MSPEFDERDAFILAGRQVELDGRQGPRVGDWIEFADGMVARISHDWGDSVQYSYGGSFYLGDGYASYSGGLEPGIPVDSLTPTDEVRPGPVWFFHHDQARAHNGVNTAANFRVYRASGNTHRYYCMKCSAMVDGVHRLEHKQY